MPRPERWRSEYPWHDWLGPAYLPLHAYNPLERVLLDVPFDVLLASEESLSSGDRRVLDAFGV